MRNSGGMGPKMLIPCQQCYGTCQVNEYTEADRKRDDAYFMAHSKRLREWAEKHNKWRRRTLQFLLTHMAPRLAALGGGMDQAPQFARLVSDLCQPIDFSRNHVGKVAEQESICLMLPMSIGFFMGDILEREEYAQWHLTHDPSEWQAYQAARKAANDHKTRLHRRRTDRACRRWDRDHPKE